MRWRNQLSSQWRTLPSAWTGAAAPVRPDFSAHDAFSEHLRMLITTYAGTDEGCRRAPITAPSLTPVALPGDPVRGAARADFDLMFAACSKRDHVACPEFTGTSIPRSAALPGARCCLECEIFDRVHDCYAVCKATGHTQTTQEAPDHWMGGWLHRPPGPSSRPPPPLYSLALPMLCVSCF